MSLIDLGWVQAFVFFKISLDGSNQQLGLRAAGLKHLFSNVAAHCDHLQSFNNYLCLGPTPRVSLNWSWAQSGLVEVNTPQERLMCSHI